MEDPAPAYLPATQDVHVEDPAPAYATLASISIVRAAGAVHTHTYIYTYIHMRVRQKSDPPDSDHVPVKPLEVALPSDVNVTFRKPVVERYTLDELRDPEFLRMRCDDSSQLHV